MVKLTLIQIAVLGALLDVETTAEPAHPEDVGRIALRRLGRSHKYPRKWAASHLYTLGSKKLTSSPGSPRGKWRITDAGRRALEGEE